MKARAVGNKKVPQQVPLSEWAAPENQWRYVTRGELLSMLDACLPQMRAAVVAEVVRLLTENLAAPQEASSLVTLDDVADGR